jgi:hypothetical protein
MHQQKDVLKYLFTAIVVVAVCSVSQAQTGSFSAVITSQNSLYKSISINFNKPLFKFNDSHGYWFTNPHNGNNHFTLMPPPGYGNTDAVFIDITNSANDIDVYTLTSDDSDNVSFKNTQFAITAPAWRSRDKENNKPLHFHFTTLTASEVAFTVSGTVQVSSLKGNGEDPGTSSINGSGHFYREPKYEKSDVLPGCDCDPTIYASVYDAENYVRTTSACENALANKLFDAVQRSMAPLFTNVAYQGKGKMNVGDISITMIAGHVDINVPVKERPYCSADYYHNRLTGFDAHKKIFNNDDAYGLRFIKIPGDEETSPSAATTDNNKRQIAIMDSISKLMAAKKITSEQYAKAINDFATGMSNNKWPDLKKLETEKNLYVTIIVNANNNDQLLLNLADKNKTVILHTIKGAAFEVFSPTIKDGDGNWVSNREAIYLGKFSNPVKGKSIGGYDAITTNAVYPVNGNKLTIYNIIIKMEGGKDLIDKAIANIDFAALQELISKQ